MGSNSAIYHFLFAYRPFAMPEHITDLISLAFFAANGGRIVAYFPQVLAASRCKNGAKSISRMTWGYFAIAHFTGVLYAYEVVHNEHMALVFLGNCLVCSLLVAIVTWKKRWVSSAQSCVSLCEERRDSSPSLGRNISYENPIRGFKSEKFA